MMSKIKRDGCDMSELLFEALKHDILVPIFVDGSATWTDPISIFIAAVFPWLGIAAVVKGRAAVITVSDRYDR